MFKINIIKVNMSPIVINWHVTEKCNYSCKYCYAKYGVKKEFGKEIHNSLDDSREIITRLYDFFSRENKSVRLNFAGGEPFLIPNIRHLIKYAKELGMDVSFISNGSALTLKIAKEIAPFISIAGFSIDSIDVETNKNIGRVQRSQKSLVLSDLLEKITIFKKYGALIKINTVVSKFNYAENFGSTIDIISPEKWKILRALPVITSNGLVTPDQFNGFVERHKNFDSIIKVEDNDAMENSYIMIDPMGRFYQNSGVLNGYTYSKSILENGVEITFNQVRFDREKFESRY